MGVYFPQHLKIRHFPSEGAVGKCPIKTNKQTNKPTKPKKTLNHENIKPGLTLNVSPVQIPGQAYGREPM